MSEKNYAKYLLFLLIAIAAVSFFDRFVFALALEPIRADLHLSDTQLGLMTGIAFAVFYAFAGIPIARWADRGDRITISAIAVGLLGVAVSLCGMAANFIQLLTTRAGVAVGEAGAVPAAQSLISDYYDRQDRPHVLALYFMSYPISMILGYFLGGLLLDIYGWRTTFILIGIPGLVVAVVAKMTLKDPRKCAAQIGTLGALHVESPSLRKTFKVLWRIRSFRHIFMSFCIAYFFMMGISQWLPSFFIRTHGFNPGELGVWLAVVWGVFGILGNFLGGVFCKYIAPGDERKQFQMLAYVIALYVPVSALAYLAPDKYIALALTAVTAVLTTVGNGPIFASVQSLVDERMRSVAVAILFLFANLIGFGFGPLGVGILSDLFEPYVGSNALRYALLAFSPGGFWLAVHYWKVSESISDDILAQDKAVLNSTVVA
tara:strand:- start:6703 stop:7998 length:1296 start_codon:yes stop_codon:yes gene_type:complete